MGALRSPLKDPWDSLSMRNRLITVTPACDHSGRRSPASLFARPLAASIAGGEPARSPRAVAPKRRGAPQMSRSVDLFIRSGLPIEEVASEIGRLARLTLKPGSL